MSGRVRRSGPPGHDDNQHQCRGGGDDYEGVDDRLSGGRRTDYAAHHRLTAGRRVYGISRTRGRPRILLNSTYDVGVADLEMLAEEVGRNLSALAHEGPYESGAELAAHQARDLQCRCEGQRVL